MDIMVTCPKSEIEHFWDDELEGGEEFWNLSQRPKKLNEGDSIWFVVDGSIQAKAIVTHIETGDTQCDITDRIWSGIQVFFDNFEDLRGTEFEKPIKGFRNFRYKDGWFND